MIRRKLAGRLTVQVLLLLGATIFLLPLLWMVSTALKPIEQTMTVPPQWLPYAYTVPADAPRATREAPGPSAPGPSTPAPSSEALPTPAAAPREGASTNPSDADPDAPPIEVKPLSVLREPAVVVRTERGPIRVFRTSAGEDVDPANILRHVNASPEHPWQIVTRADEESDDWFAVPAEVMSTRVQPRWNNFADSITAMKFFWTYLWNTVVLCVLSVIGTVSSCALVAYGFSRIDWPGRNKAFVVVLATMMIPFPVVMVPLYTLFRSIGWVGTLKPLWVPAFLATPFSVFLLRQFFMTIPKDLSDAARIDGCSEFRIFCQVIVPLSKPALLVVGLFQFLATWNDFLGPLIFLTDQHDFTLALGLQFFQSQQGGTQWHYLMAASTLIILPVVVLFFVAQRYFVEGIALTGIKG